MKKRKQITKKKIDLVNREFRTHSFLQKLAEIVSWKKSVKTTLRNCSTRKIL